MADGELGNLRRAPRLIEHKIAKQSRFRTEGMAGGQFDAVIPVDVTDTISSLSDSASDGGGPVPEWFTESFTLTTGAAATLTLTYIPVDYSEILTLNGIRLSETTDYTISENVVTWTSIADLILGIGSDSWTLTATYPYYDQAAAADPILLSVTATVTSGTAITLPSAPTATNCGILVQPSGDAAPSGAFATWTQLRSSGGGPNKVDIWMGTGVGTGSIISGNLYMACAVYDGVATVAIRDIQSLAWPSPGPNPGTGTVSAPAATAVVGDLAMGAIAVTAGSDVFYPTGAHSETGFGSALSACGASSGTAGGGTAATAGLATATSIDASFGVAAIGAAGWGEVINVSFTWTQA